MRDKDYAISLIRIISFIMIVICHICQFYGNELAWWLNCGVQIFLIMSGFLYGQRDYIKSKEFYTRNIAKILIDYYIWLIIVIPIYLFLIQQHIKNEEYLKLFLGIGTGIPGLGHLWYISTIIVCYLITPFVIKLIKPNVQWFKLAILFIVVEGLCIVVPGFTGAWINCYVIGFMIGASYKKNEDEQMLFSRILNIFIPFMIMLCGTEIGIKYIANIQMIGIAGKVLNTIYHYGRISLAVVFFIGGLKLLHARCFGARNKIKILDFSDLYTYDAYIVHLFFVMGPYSFFAGKSESVFIILWCIILTFYITIAAFILNTISVFVRCRLRRVKLGE